MSEEVVQEAMILAGGLGSRLRPIVADRPKSMANVAGRPFILFLLDQLLRYKFRRAILCVGHMGECLRPQLGDRYGSMDLVYSVERSALGTGGALRHAMHLVGESSVLAMNGDSYCDIDLRELGAMHRKFRAAATLAVLEMSSRQLVGGVALDPSGRITAFENRVFDDKAGLINAGLYMLSRELLERIPSACIVSLESEVFPALAERRELFGWQVAGRFIDIGTPESYGAAQNFF